jgi:hypothetical protein
MINRDDNIHAGLEKTAIAAIGLPMVAGGVAGHMKAKRSGKEATGDMIIRGGLGAGAGTLGVSGAALAAFLVPAMKQYKAEMDVWEAGGRKGEEPTKRLRGLTKRMKRWSLPLIAAQLAGGYGGYRLATSSKKERDKVSDKMFVKEKKASVTEGHITIERDENIHIGLEKLAVSAAWVGGMAESALEAARKKGPEAYEAALKKLQRVRARHSRNKPFHAGEGVRDIEGNIRWDRRGGRNRSQQQIDRPGLVDTLDASIAMGKTRDRPNFGSYIPKGTADVTRPSSPSQVRQELSQAADQDDVLRQIQRRANPRMSAGLDISPGAGARHQRRQQRIKPAVQAALAQPTAAKKLLPRPVRSALGLKPFKASKI